MGDGLSSLIQVAMYASAPAATAGSWLHAEEIAEHEEEVAEHEEEVAEHEEEVAEHEEEVAEHAEEVAEHAEEVAEHEEEVGEHSFVVDRRRASGLLTTIEWSRVHYVVVDR